MSFKPMSLCLAALTGLICLTNITYASSSCTNVRFQQLSKEAGLSQSFVNEIVQDKDGFMWFGTQQGLNRYDGYDIKVFTYHPAKPNSISGNDIRALLVDSKGVLWVGTLDGGLSYYVKESGTFVNHLKDATSNSHISINHIRSLFEDAKGNLWIGTADDGISLSDRNNNSFQSNPGVLKTLAGLEIWDILEDRYGYL
ncbi:MAG: ligand-binding sensor domain-containing protein [Flavobacterium sp.]|jgi:ligand-binding sensor domain-containing protein